MSNIICLTQDNIETPYKFKLTGIRVYSFEEALYHFYHYWKQSSDDFLNDDFILWVKRDLDLDYLSTKISELRSIDKFSDRYTKFISIVDYFSEQEVHRLKADLEDWEKRLVWEQLKDKADSLVNIGEYEKAINIYLNAVKINPDADIYNNLGVAYNKIGDYKNAYATLTTAYSIGSNPSIIFNLAETSILNGNFDNGEMLIDKLENQEDKNYLFGLFYLERGRFELARDYFLKAHALKKDDFYLYKTVEACISQKYYDDALKILNLVKNKDEEYFIKQAEIYFLKNKVTESISILSDATEKFSSIELWTELSKYHRLNNDFESATIAIERARVINPVSVKVEFENANIKKSQGKIKDFQAVLHNILGFLKKVYRANNDY